MKRTVKITWDNDAVTKTLVTDEDLIPYLKGLPMDRIVSIDIAKLQ